jgi:outer membrane protein
LPLKAKEAELNLAKARQQAEAFDSDREYAEHALAVLLGSPPEDRVGPAEEDRAPLPLPLSEEESVRSAVAASKELRRLESALTSKGFEIGAIRAQRLPQVDLVAQYALLGRYNNYAEFFRAFQRHNGQLGVSFRVPLFPHAGIDAKASLAQTEAAQLSVQLRNAKSTIALQTRRLYQLAHQADGASTIAKLDLEVARGQLSLLLARLEEGRASLQQVEEARFIEDQKWIAFLDAHYALERARLNLLSQTGELLALLR